ncbi:MAG: hypothetical protein EA399_00700 [Desulfovibrionales bacterium]|nr:MAG: hypothetical protein EA399_00700 [Desulfovibrionales bacterium]
MAILQGTRLPCTGFNPRRAGLAGGGQRLGGSGAGGGTDVAMSAKALAELGLATPRRCPLPRHIWNAKGTTRLAARMGASFPGMVWTMELDDWVAV